MHHYRTNDNHDRGGTADQLGNERYSIVDHGKTRGEENPKKSVGRYVSPEARGKVTKRRPKSDDHSPRWFGWLILGLMVFGIVVITLNYLSVLPGSTSAWYLAVGLVAMFSGFYLATRYK